jgi:hypothetical protein
MLHRRAWVVDVQLVMDEFQFQPVKLFSRKRAAPRSDGVIQRCLETVCAIGDALSDVRFTGAPL